MAKGSSAVWIDQLVNLLGLDKETVKMQIIPFLDSFDNEASLRDHLQGLVGTDSPLARSFVRDFTRSRFPQQAASASGTSTSPTAAPSVSSSSSHAHPKKRGKKTLAERAGIGQPLPPRKVQDAGLYEHEQMAKLAEAFGGMGTVYRRKQEEEEFFAGTGKGKKGKHAASKADAHHTSDTPQSGYATPVEHIIAEAEPASQPAQTQNETSTSEAKPSPPPTAEMLEIDAVVEELTSTDAAASATSSKVLDRKLCFCQGRKHALAPYAPLCYSCGLILCSAIYPSPLSPLSSCPSCNATPLLSGAARSDLVAKLAAEREVLFEQQLLQIQIQREMKKLNKTAVQSAREQEAALFPKLGMEAASSSSSGMPHAGPVVGKHGALLKAKASAGDAQRTAKVLSLDMKTHKLKMHTKVTRPKPVHAASAKAEVKENDAEGGKEEGEVEQDPFVGLDGSALVRNEADDGLSGGSGAKMNGKAKVGKANKSIPGRTWSFKDQQLTLRSTGSVH